MKQILRTIEFALILSLVFSSFALADFDSLPVIVVFNNEDIEEAVRELPV